MGVRSVDADSPGRRQLHGSLDSESGTVIESLAYAQVSEVSGPGVK